MQIRRHWLRHHDWVLIVLSGILLFTGWLFIHGTALRMGGRFENYGMRQAVWIAAGAAIFIVLSLMDYRALGPWAWVLFVAANAGLLAVLFFGREVNSSRSWLSVFGVSFQPAEFAKPVALLFLAWLASRPFFRMRQSLYVVVFVALAAVPVLLIAKQPDWGTALVFVPAALTLAFLAGLRWQLILAGLALVVVAGPLAYRHLLAEHQRERIDTFLKPSQDLSDAGYNAHQSLLAVGSGGVWGKGYMHGDMHVLGFLPRTVAPTDFIVAVIGEETGFVGVAMLIGALAGVILCCLRTAVAAPDRFGAYLCGSVGALLFFHAFVNIGMAVQAAPIIGIPLPLVSYGGSFLVATMACLGLVNSVHAHRETTTGDFAE